MSGIEVPRAVLFDIGGVLEVTPSTGWQARWEQRLGIAPGAIDERLVDVYRAGTIGALSLSDAESRIAALLAVDDATLGEVMTDLWTEYLGTLDVPLTTWFRALRPRFKTGIVSNSWVGAREKEAERHDFGTLCDTIVYSHEEGIAKPDPRIYQIACARLGVTPEETVFVDDLKANVAAARALGMRALLFTGDTPQTIAELESLLEEQLA